MHYYEILRFKRQSLNLSIQQIAIQTQLPASELSLIENHQLQDFSLDTFYLRILIQAYCNVLGISWNLISDEVSEDIHHLQTASGDFTVPEEKINTKSGKGVQSVRSVRRLRFLSGSLYLYLSFCFFRNWRVTSDFERNLQVRFCEQKILSE